MFQASYYDWQFNWTSKCRNNKTITVKQNNNKKFWTISLKPKSFARTKNAQNCWFPDSKIDIVKCCINSLALRLQTKLVNLQEIK